jgi:hypothetical protein
MTQREKPKQTPVCCRQYKARSQKDFGPMERYSKLTPRAFADGAHCSRSTLLPSGLYRRRRLCKNPCSPHSCIRRSAPSARGLSIHNFPAIKPGKWITADRELGFHPHPALKVLS